MITQAVIDACGLIHSGFADSYHVGGKDRVRTFLVDIELPNHVECESIRAIEGIIPHGANVLIGMDIITLGDFAVTHRDRKTKFSFRFPSQADIDFVEEDRS